MQIIATFFSDSIQQMMTTTQQTPTKSPHDYKGVKKNTKKSKESAKNKWNKIEKIIKIARIFAGHRLIVESVVIDHHSLFRIRRRDFVRLQLLNTYATAVKLIEWRSSVLHSFSCENNADEYHYLGPRNQFISQIHIVELWLNIEPFELAIVRTNYGLPMNNICRRTTRTPINVSRVSD